MRRRAGEPENYETKPIWRRGDCRGEPPHPALSPRGEGLDGAGRSAPRPPGGGEGPVAQQREGEGAVRRLEFYSEGRGLSRFAPQTAAARPSSKADPLLRISLRDERVHHHLLAGLVEADGELVVLDGAHGAVAEFLVEDAVALGEAADAAQFVAAQRHRAALDDRRAAAQGAQMRQVGARRQALPLALALAQARARIEAGVGQDVDMLSGQLGDEARRE